MISLKGLATAVLLTAVATLSGCYSARPEDIKAFLRPYEAQVTFDDYRLMPPDVIEIRSTGIPQLDQQQVTIRPDGRIGFENLGEFYVAGKTPIEVAGELQERAAGLFNLQDEYAVNVRLVSTASKFYYVMGEVRFPGVKISTGRDTVMTAISAAGPTVLAWESRVQVIRPTEYEDDRPFVFEVDYSRMSQHGDLTKNVLLQEGDIIFVPPTIIAMIAMKIEEFVRPIARAFSATAIMQQ